MRPNRVFFPQALLDSWIADDRVDLGGDQLLLRDEGRRYKIEEAVHVIADAAGGADAAGLIGKVKTRSQLAEHNAEILENSLIVGDDAYEVVPGFVGEPVGSFESRAAEATGEPTPAANDEQLLAQFLLESL
jgi:hypothetical protein